MITEASYAGTRIASLRTWTADNSYRQSRHFPSFNTSTNWSFIPRQSDPTERDVRDYIVPILEANGVQLVLTGHEHNYQRTHPVRAGKIAPDGNGVVYITTGGGGADLYPELSSLPQTAFERVTHHYLRVDANDRALKIVAISDSGEEFDEVILTL